MMQEHLPAVLAGVGKQQGLAMLRALKQIKELLELGTFDRELTDSVEASIDDIDIMIGRVQWINPDQALAR